MENISKLTEEAREDEVLQLAENENIAQDQNQNCQTNLVYFGDIPKNQG